MKHAATTTGLTLTLFLLTAVPALAQGRSLEYTETTSIEAAGAMGALLARSGNSEATRAAYVLDDRLRTDDGSSSMIFDATAREWTILLHEEEAFMTFSLGDMLELTEEIRQEMEASRSEAEAVRREMDEEMEELEAELREAMAEAERTMDVSLEHRATGERGRVHGYAAERHQLVTTVENAEEIQGAEDVEGGSLVVLLDIWMSEEFAREHPLYVDEDDPESNPFYRTLVDDPAFRELAEEMTADFEATGPGEGLETFASIDPRVGAALGETFESLAEIPGMPVRTTTVVAVVPATVELDVDLLVAWEPESMGDRIRGEATAAAREAARDAARDAVSGLTRGFLGGRGDDDEPEVDEEDLIIRPLFRLTTEVIDVRAGGSPAPDLFTVPDGYRELSLVLEELGDAGGPG